MRAGSLPRRAFAHRRFFDFARGPIAPGFAGGIPSSSKVSVRVTPHGKAPRRLLPCRPCEGEKPSTKQTSTTKKAIT